MPFQTCVIIMTLRIATDGGVERPKLRLVVLGPRSCLYLKLVVINFFFIFLRLFFYDSLLILFILFI